MKAEAGMRFPLASFREGFYWVLIVWGILFITAHAVYPLDFNLWDNFNYFTPVLADAHAQWLAGYIPFWTEHQHMGEPLLANGMAGVLYLPYTFCLSMVRLFRLDLKRLTLVITLVHLPWGAWGWHRLMRKLHVRPLLAAATSISICFSGCTCIFSSIWIFTVAFFSWGPWLLAGILDILLSDEPIRRGPWMIASSIGALGCIGHPQFFSYVLLWSILWGCLFSTMMNGASFAMARFFIPGLCGFLFSAALWMPLLQSYRWGIRSQGLEFSYFLARSVPREALEGLLWPFFDVRNDYLPYQGSMILYQGFWVLPVVLGALGLSKSSLRGRSAAHQLLLKAFLTSFGVSIFFLMLALGSHGWIYPLTSRLPIWSSFRWPFRLLTIAVPSLGLTAGLALELWARHQESTASKWRWILLGIYIFLFAFIFLGPTVHTFSPAVHVCIIAGAVLCVMASMGTHASSWTRWFLLGSCLTAVGTLGAVNESGLLTYRESYGNWGPQTFGIDPGYRVLPVTTMPFLQSQPPIMQPLGLFASATANGYDSATGSTGAMAPLWYLRFFGSNDVGLLMPETYAFLLRSHFLQACNVRYFIAGHEDRQAHKILEKAAAYAKIKTIGDIDVFERNGVLSRAYFADAVVPYSSQAFTEGMFFNRAGLRTAFLEGPVQNNSSLPPARILEQHWWPHSRQFQVDAPRGGVLIISSTFFPEWRAKIDGKTATVRRANGMFQGIWVPPNSHEVIVSYHSAAFIQGLWIGMAGLCFMFLWTRKSMRKPHDANL